MNHLVPWCCHAPCRLQERSLRLRTILKPKNRDTRKPMYSIYIYSMRRLESVLEILYSLSYQLPKNATTRWFRAKSTYSTSTRSFGWPNILLVNCWSKTIVWKIMLLLNMTIYQANSAIFPPLASTRFMLGALPPAAFNCSMRTSLRVAGNAIATHSLSNEQSPRLILMNPNMSRSNPKPNGLGRGYLISGAGLRNPGWSR